jgi:GAF domain-containing protein
MPLDAATDPLTGLANSRAFRQALEAGRERALADGRPLAVVLLDLDGFKQVNDRRGHQAGDRLLCEVAAALRRAARPPSPRPSAAPRHPPPPSRRPEPVAGHAAARHPHRFPAGPGDRHDTMAAVPDRSELKR